MWTVKKQKRLLKSLRFTQRQINSTPYKLRLLRSLAPRPPRSSTTRSASMPSKYPKPQKTLRNEIAALKRKVGKLKPAPVYFQTSFFPSSYTSGNEYMVSLVNLTETIKNLSTFRDNINGDEWYNDWLRLQFTLNKSLKYMRVIVYTPRKTGTQFNPTASASGFAVIPDPAAFKVHMDTIVNTGPFNKHNTSDPEEQLRSLWCSLKGLKTVYNGSSDTIEENEVRMTILHQSNNGTVLATGYTGYFQARLTDKS